MDRYVVYLLDIRTLEGGIIFTISSYFQTQPQISWTGYVLRSPSHPTHREGDMHWNRFFHCLMIFTLISFHTILYHLLFDIHWHDQHSTGQDPNIKHQQRMRMSLSLSLAQLSLSWFKSSKCTWFEGFEQILTYPISLGHFR